MRKVPLRNPNKQSPASGAQTERRRPASQAERTVRSEERHSAQSDRRAEERSTTRRAEERRAEERSLRAEERRLDRRAKEEKREIRAEERTSDRRRRVEEKQAEAERRAEAKILREEERNLDARRRVDEKRAAEAKRAEDERRREWEAREQEKERRRKSKRAEQDARTEDKERRLQNAARKRKLREAKRREREERKKARMEARKSHPGFYNPELKIHTLIAVLLCLLAVYIAVSLVLREYAGGIGLAIAEALLGCFSYTAFLIPLFMLIHALFWHRDVRDRILIPKALAFPPLLLIAATFAGIFAPNFEETAYDAPTAYLAGHAYTGGGAVGDAIAHALKNSIGFIGIFLVALLALAPFVLLYFRRPFKTLVVLLRTRVQERKIARAQAAAEKKEPHTAQKEEPRLPAPQRVAVDDGAEPSAATDTEAPAAEQRAAVDRRRALVRDLEEDALPVERQQIGTGGRGRRLFDFETAEIEEEGEGDDIFAPVSPQKPAEPARRGMRDPMAFDDDGDDFADEGLGITRERLRPVAHESAPVSSPAPRKTNAEAQRPAAAQKPAETQASSGMDYFRSITVSADMRGSASGGTVQVPPSAMAGAAPVVTAAAPLPVDAARPVVTEPVRQAPVAEPVRPTAAPVSAAVIYDGEDEDEDDEVSTEVYAGGDSFFDAPDEDEAPEVEEEIPFTPTSSLRTDLSAMRAVDPPAPKERADGAFRPLTLPDEKREAAAPSHTATPTPPPAPPKPKRPYQFPPVSLLALPEIPDEAGIAAEIQINSEKLVQTLADFKVPTRITGYSRGPRITRYEVVPEAGVRVRSISNLVEDISMSLATSGIRIEAPIPGKSAVGVEVPNATPTMVRLRHLLDTQKFRDFPEKTVVCLGEEVTGQPVYCDLAKTPHMLVAGATGMGKSVCINSIITSILYKATPDEVKLIMIDPKKVEFSLYKGIPHLLVPVVTDPKKAAGALSWAVSEMERRFGLFEKYSVRDLKGYNRSVAETGEEEALPRIIIIIDELHDLMMSAKDTVETSIARITAKARAAGIHLLIGTQRPSVDVITGTIKNNIPTRIAFHVSSQVDSRTILDFVGAEKLLPHGDMLYAAVGAPKPQRVQGAFVDEKEIERIVEFIKSNNDTMSDEETERIMADIEREAEKCTPQKKGEEDDIPAGGGMNIPTDDDDRHLQWAALEVGFEFSRLSTSLLQRKLKIGYGKAAKILDALCEEGYISEPDGAKPREILITHEEFKEMMARAVHEETGGNF